MTFMTSSHDPSVPMSAYQYFHAATFVNMPKVVPAECIEYFNPDFFISRCTSATSFETDAVGVPIGIRQKSAVHLAGVDSCVGSPLEDMLLRSRGSVEKALRAMRRADMR